MLNKDEALIFGKTWEEIRAIQQKTFTANTIKPGPMPVATSQDIDLLKEYGIDGLREKQFFGVIDRLQNSEIIKNESTPTTLAAQESEVVTQLNVQPPKIKQSMQDSELELSKKTIEPDQNTPPIGNKSKFTQDPFNRNRYFTETVGVQVMALSGRKYEGFFVGRVGATGFVTEPLHGMEAAYEAALINYNQYVKPLTESDNSKAAPNKDNQPEGRSDRQIKRATSGPTASELGNTIRKINERIAGMNKDPGETKQERDKRKTSYVDWFVNYTEQQNTGRTTETKRVASLKEAKEFAQGKFGYITRTDDGGVDFSTEKASTKFIEFFGGFSPSAQEQLNIKNLTSDDDRAATSEEEESTLCP